MRWHTYLTNLSRNTVLGQLLTYWIFVIDAFEAEEFAEVATKPLKALPYETHGRSLWHLSTP
ncbi:hypothetical protein HanIR_Chr12g0584831 [Helianthus annuus]|nr:hypothetical protein HanIR_Chr12g0584831 [Helianthus annuus]